MGATADSDITRSDVHERHGTQAIHRVLQYAFDDLHLRRVFVTLDEDNTRVMRCFEKCGFVREGLLRQHRLRYGQSINMVMMGILSEEYHAANS